ncbi:hypothetical protein M0805_008926 [Coniferiporia weirii]|nr:hypothetical protein M0805_008926 [Coniferiporia weirii]
MRTTLPRLIAILPRGEVPKQFQGRIIPPLLRPDEQHAASTLIDHLNARKEELTKAYLTAQQKAQETGALTVNAQTWPTNLRIEPVIKRNAFAKVSKDVRMQLKEALKEQ